jgi:hypothetical protein
MRPLKVTIAVGIWNLWLYCSLRPGVGVNAKIVDK